MRLTDTLGLARDNLSRARLRTALTAVGVAIGTAAVVTLISFGNGTEAIAVGQANSYGSLTMIQVTPWAPVRGRGAPWTSHALTPAALAAITRLPHVSGVDRSLDLPPLRLTIGARSFDLPAQAQTPLQNGVTLVAGSDHMLQGDDTVLLPASVVQRLHLKPTALLGRRVTLTAGGDVCCANPNGGMTVVGPERHFTARVGGVYDDSRSSANGPPDAKGADPIVGVSATFGAAILGRLSDLSGAAYLSKHGYTQLMVHTDDARQTEPVAARIKAMPFAVFDRADLLARLHLTFAILTGGLGAIGGIALLVAAVGIANTMIMTILERTREIGIMKALGAEPGTVRRLFLTETALVGLIGGVVGLLLAALASVVGNAIFRIWMTGQGYTPPGSLFVIAPTLIVGALVLAAAISLIAGAWPSRRAVRLQPLDALRYE